jgi:hypothetical protein
MLIRAQQTWAVMGEHYVFVDREHQYHNPLVVIDGVIGDMNLINPQDVESISSFERCCFGINLWFKSRNGVILITTKKGKSSNLKLFTTIIFESKTIQYY